MSPPSQATIDRESRPVEFAQKQSGRTSLTVRPPSALVAIVLFLTINLALDKSCRHLVSEDNWSLVASSAIQQYRQLPAPPSIVLFGSSLMGRAMWRADSWHSLVKPGLPYENYHNAQWFNKQLEESGLRGITIFDFAIDGATTADLYLLCDKLLKPDHQPKLIIYGAAARDVSGCLFNCERNTPTFKLLFEPEDCSRLGHLYSTCWDEQLELEIYQRFPLHQNRQVLKEQMTKEITALASRVFADTCLGTTNSNSSSLASQYATPSSVMRTEMNARFGSSAAKDRKRLNNHLFCLHQLARWTAERNTYLLIVNMPMLVGSFRDTEIYNDYRKTLGTCADYQHTSLLDLADNNAQFTSDCFYDGAHLNAKGATILIGKLTKWLKDHPYALNTQ